MSLPPWIVLPPIEFYQKINVSEREIFPIVKDFKTNAMQLIKLFHKIIQNPLVKIRIMLLKKCSPSSLLHSKLLKLVFANRKISLTWALSSRSLVTKKSALHWVYSSMNGMPGQWGSWWSIWYLHKYDDCLKKGISVFFILKVMHY